MKFYWFNKHCCVPECSNSSTEGEGCFKEYFDLPAEPQARARWLNAVLTEDGENLKVCEDHFKDDDVFRDKSNRKKLRLNSIPSLKLPKNVCTNCLGYKNQLYNPTDFQVKTCLCEQTSAALQPIQQGKRTRITWTFEEKRILFIAIKNHGDVKMGNNNIRINWANVTNHCRGNGCFGNEKELRSVWQTMRLNAAKVYRNEIFGSKLDRKVSRFLYGKPPQKGRSGWASPGCSSAKGSNQNMDVVSTDEEEEEKSRPIFEYLHEEEENNGAILEDDNKHEPIGVDDTKDDMKTEQLDAPENDELAEDSDEYYSKSDVEQIFQITIGAEPPETPTEVISLLSSDEEQF